MLFPTISGVGNYENENSQALQISRKVGTGRDAPKPSSLPIGRAKSRAGSASQGVYGVREFVIITNFPTAQ
jgi:hypothetical protein